jgi:hypothetical protein
MGLFGRKDTQLAERADIAAKEIDELLTIQLPEIMELLIGADWKETASLDYFVIRQEFCIFVLEVVVRQVAPQLGGKGDAFMDLLVAAIHKRLPPVSQSQFLEMYKQRRRQFRDYKVLFSAEGVAPQGALFYEFSKSLVEAFLDTDDFAIVAQVMANAVLSTRALIEHFSKINLLK